MKNINKQIISLATSKVGKIHRVYKDKLYVSFDYDYVSIPISLLKYKDIILVSDEMKTYLDKKIQKYQRKYDLAVA